MIREGANDIVHSVGEQTRVDQQSADGLDGKAVCRRTNCAPRPLLEIRH